MTRKFTMKERGQAFEAYRLLIAMAISLAVLTIIVATISYFDALRQQVSRDTLYTSWKSAVDSPNEQVVIARNLSFTQGTQFTRKTFAERASIDEACIQLDADSGAGFSLDPNAQAFVQAKTTLIGSVFMQCSLQNFIDPPGPDDCFAYCLVSFGKLIGG